MKLFLSHLSRDKTTVMEFKDKLPAFIRDWIDVEALSWGDTLEEQLKNAVTAEVDFVLLFLAHDTLTSNWVNKELRWALDTERSLGRKYLLPILLEPRKHKKLPPELEKRLFLSLHDFEGDSITKLARDATLKLFQIVAESWPTVASSPTKAASQLLAVAERAVRRKYDSNQFWTRPILRLPLPDGIADDVTKVMRAACRTAFESLKEAIPDAVMANIRTNIFLPTAERIREGDFCTLVIPTVSDGSTVQHNMVDTKECGIKFRPGEGATGKVFVRQHAIGAVTHPKWVLATSRDERKAIERWVYVGLSPSDENEDAIEALSTDSGRRDFQMSDFHNGIVDERVTWIISIPIFRRVGEQMEVVGVFNIDCVKTAVEPALLKKLFYQIVPFAGCISGLVQPLELERVCIFKVESA